ncbi:MAG: hypothetical protein U0638_12490 [Phycisphaerales bacterium]
MTIPVTVLPKAKLAIAWSMDYYEKLRPGYGGLFLIEIERTFDIIAHWPEAYELVTSRLRRAPVRRFNDLVVYRPLQSGVRILNVVAARRDPAITRSLDLP